MTLRPEGLRLRLVETATGRPTLWHEELEAAFAQQTAANRDAEERIRALEAELRRLRRQ